MQTAVLLSDSPLLGKLNLPADGSRRGFRIGIFGSNEDVLLVFSQHLRRRLTRLDLGAHLLNPRFLFIRTGDDGFEFLSLLGQRCSQFLDPAMFFEKFVEQHRVHRIVANGQRLALRVAYHQVDRQSSQKDTTVIQAKRMLSIKRVLPKNTANRSTEFALTTSTGFNVSASTTST